MQKIHTHYENLKVTRNAPSEVIRAAYKTLSQKHHPDRNVDNPDAKRVMSIINESYEVLSDPVKRKEHDEWIANKESEKYQSPKREQPIYEEAKPSTYAQSSKTNQTARKSINYKKWISHVFNNWFLYGFAAWMFWIYLNDKPKPPPIGPLPYIANPSPEILPSPEPPAYVRSLNAPNNEPWPTIAGYVNGYKKLNTKGLSTVTVDNGQNDSDVFVKLVSVSGDKAYPVRQFYIPAYGKFTVNKVNSGNYDVRYRDLSNGGLSRSESFNLEETKTETGTRYSIYTMTLYKVKDGNMKTYDLSEMEF